MLFDTDIIFGTFQVIEAFHGFKMFTFINDAHRFFKVVVKCVWISLPICVKAYIYLYYGYLTVGNFKHCISVDYNFLALVVILV